MAAPERSSRVIGDRIFARRDVWALLCLCLAIALLFSAEWSGKSYFQAESESLAVLISEALNIAAYAACALACRRFERVLTTPKSRTAVLLAAGVLAALGRAMLACASLAGAGAELEPLTVCGLALHSLCEPILLLACLFLLCQERLSRAAAVLPASFIVAGLAMTLKQFATFAAMELFVVAGPMLAAVFLLLSVRLSGERSGSEKAPEVLDAPGGVAPARLPLWPFVLMVVYDLVYHLIIVVDAASSSFGMLGLVALSVFALVLAFVRRHDYSPLVLNKIALPCVVAALMCLSLPSPGPEFSAFLSNTGSAAFYLFVFITFIAMCRRQELDAARSLGAFLAIEHVGHLMGDAIGLAFLQVFPGDAVALQLMAAIIAVVMIVTVTFFFNDLEVARIFGLIPDSLLVRSHEHTDASAVVSVMSSRENVAWQCATAARVHGLTVREQQVLECILLDMTNQQIADAMTVSLGTVKSHVSHICRKLGVETRAEVMEACK